jgi:hypothetical protein
MLQIPAHVNIGFVVGRLFYGVIFLEKLHARLKKRGVGLRFFWLFVGRPG